jgi:ubiquinone biosynthesis protein UbiJ
MQHFVLEQALNFLIQNSAINLKLLDKKTIKFSLEDLPLEVNFVCANNRIFVLNATSNPSDVDIKLNTSVFFALFKGENLTDLLRQDKLIINGDVKTAQLLVDILKEADIDLEEILSHYTGDIVAYEVGKISKKIKQFTQNSSNPLDTIKNGISELLIRPVVSKTYKNKQH